MQKPHVQSSDFAITQAILEVSLSVGHARVEIGMAASVPSYAFTVCFMQYPRWEVC